MKLSFTRLLAICLAMLTFHVSFAQTNYRSASSGDWTTTPASRWEIETSPGVWGPAVTAPTSADGVITIRNGHNITVGVATVTADEVVVATGGTLTVNNTLTLNDGTGVDLEVDGTLSLNNTLATGTGTPTVQIDATFDWIGGTLSVPTTVSATGTLNINTSNKTLTTTLTNDGTINWSASQVSFNNGTLNNNATVSATGDNSFNSGAGTNAFNNNATGIFTKSVGAGSSTISIPVTNAGTFNMNSGTIVSTSATGTFSNTGTLNFGGGALTIAGTLAGGNALNAGTVLSGTGTLNINNLTAINLALAPPSTVTLSIGGPAANTTLLNGTGSLAIDGIFNWSTARVAIPVTINATGTFNSTSGKDFAANFTNNGTANLTDNASGGSLDLEGITFTNNGTINVNYTLANRFVSNGGGTNSFVNNGTYHKTTGVTVTFAAGVPVTNTGVFEGIGSLVFTGGITNTGTISPGTPGTSPGILTVGPNAITGNATTLRLGVLNSTTPGTGHDQLVVTNSVNLTNATLVVTEPSGNVAPVGSYTIMTATAGAITGPFATVIIPGNWTITYNATSVVVNKLGSTLPLVWGSFTATAKNNNQVQLNWTTLQELNTSHFVVEQSVDGRTYTYVGTVQAKGSSAGTTEYNFVHTTPDRSKVNHYRIKQVDDDGTFSYSYIRSVRFDRGNVALVLATPNPVRDILQITVQERVNIVISDMNGRAIRRLTLGAGYHPVNLQNLQKGVYQLAVYRNDQLLEVQKLVKQ